MALGSLTSLLLLSCVALCRADTLANCSYSDIEGVWEFRVGQKVENTSADCSSFSEFYPVSCRILTDCNYKKLSGKNSTIADGKSSKSGDAFICTCPGNRDISVGESSNSFP